MSRQVVVGLVASCVSLLAACGANAQGDASAFEQEPGVTAPEVTTPGEELSDAKSEWDTLLVDVEAQLKDGVNDKTPIPYESPDQEVMQVGALGGLLLDHAKTCVITPVNEIPGLPVNIRYKGEVVFGGHDYAVAEYLGGNSEDDKRKCAFGDVVLIQINDDGANTEATPNQQPITSISA